MELSKEMLTATEEREPEVLRNPTSGASVTLLVAKDAFRDARYLYQLPLSPLVFLIITQIPLCAVGIIGCIEDLHFILSWSDFI